jgi:hypothetical protein
MKDGNVTPLLRNQRRLEMTHPSNHRGNDAYDRRSFAFRPLNGLLESEVAEASRARSRPEVVVRVLAAALTELDGRPVEESTITMLPMGQSRYLMARLAEHFGVDQRWITADCAACHKPFDFPMALAALPLETAGPDRIALETSVGVLNVRQPTCADQIAISGVKRDDREKLLLSRCIDRASDVIENLNNADILALDAAMATLAPSLPSAASAACPECGHSNAVPISTSDWLSDLGDGPLADIHTIASSYGWAEADILALPKRKRESFIRMIEQSRGMSRGEA